MKNVLALIGAFDYYKEAICTDILDDDDIITVVSGEYAADVFNKIIFKVGCKCDISFIKKRYENYNMYLNKLDEGNMAYIIVFDSTDVAFSLTFLQFVRQKFKKVKIVSIVYNTIGSNEKKAFFLKSNYDQVFSYDVDDCNRYNFNHFWGLYGNTKHSLTNNGTLMFAGAGKGREQLIEQIAELSYKNDLPVDITITSSRINKITSITYMSGRLCYSEVAKKISLCNCLLDLSSGEQSGVSIRTMEAIAYGKKLLTNNQKILEFPGYNDVQMQYFSSVDEIDWSWLKTKSSFENNMVNTVRYSVRSLIDRIIEKEDSDK